MFSSLNFPSPQLTTSRSELFSPTSEHSGVSDSGLPNAGKVETGGYKYSEGLDGDHQQDFENHDSIGSYHPPPPSQLYNAHNGYNPNTGLYGPTTFSQMDVQPAQYHQADNTHIPRLMDFPELYSQFLPSTHTQPNFTYPALSTATSLPSLHQDLSFPPPVSNVYTASKALRNALSHPALPSNRPHPYHARSLNPSNSYSQRISRMSSTAALNINARDSQNQLSRSTSSTSTPSLTISASQYSSFQAYQPSSEGGDDQDIQTPLTAGFDHATSRYYDTLLAHQPYLPENTFSQASTAIHPGHLFMSGLSDIPGANKEELRAKDAAVWAKLRGPGLDAKDDIDELDGEDSEDDEQVEDICVSDAEVEKGNDMGMEDQGEESETDTALALIRNRRIALTTPSSPTPTSTVARASSPTPTADPKLKTSQSNSASNTLGVEAEDAEATPKPRRSPSPDTSPDTFAQENDGHYLESQTTTVPFANQDSPHDALPLPPSFQAQLETTRSDQRKELDSILPTAPPSPSLSVLIERSEPSSGFAITASANETAAAVESILQLSQEPIEVEYHPSGRLKRSSRPSTLSSQPKLIIPSTSTVLSGDYDGGDEFFTSSQSTYGSDDEDEYETLEADGDEDDYGRRGARASSTKPVSSRRFGKVKIGRSLIDSEVKAKVESLRDRLMDKSRRTGNFDEKLCQSLVDDRFFPEYIRWSEDGQSIFIPRYRDFRYKAGPFVMCASVKATAFNKQFNNVGLSRSTPPGTGENGPMLLTHPRLNRDDKELWDAVEKLPKLVEHVPGSQNSSSSSNNKPKFQMSNKAALLRAKNAHQLEVDALVSQIDALKLEKGDKDRYHAALKAIRKDHPEIWTDKNVKKWGLHADDIPVPPIKSKSKTKTKTIDPVVLPGGPTLVPTKKRSRQGVVGTKTQQEEEHKLEVAVEAEEDGQQGQPISRKKSKLVLSKARK